MKSRMHQWDRRILIAVIALGGGVGGKKWKFNCIECKVYSYHLFCFLFLVVVFFSWQHFSLGKSFCMNIHNEWINRWLIENYQLFFPDYLPLLISVSATVLNCRRRCIDLKNEMQVFVCPLESTRSGLDTGGQSPTTNTGWIDHNDLSDSFIFN